MRIFRIKARNENNKVVNQCEYKGIEKLRMYGREVYRRYSNYAKAELYEYHHHHVDKWQLIPDEERVRRLMNPYLSDITN